MKQDVGAAVRARRPGAGRRPTHAPKLPPIISDGRLSIAQRVYDTLSVGLMSGSILPGMTLTSRSLSQAFGVSPTPVRDALKQLEADGALRSKSKSAFFVNDPTQSEFEDILQIRLRLEGLAIRRAASVATSKTLTPIRELNKQYERLLRAGRDVVSESLVPNFRFHFEIYRLARSPILVKMIAATWLRIGPTLHRFMTASDPLDLSATAHWNMIDALSRHDGEAAERALGDDLVGASRAILPLLRPMSDGTSAEPDPSFLALPFSYEAN